MIASMVASLRPESGHDPTTSRRYSRNRTSQSSRATLARMERFPANPFFKVDSFIAFPPTIPSTAFKNEGMRPEIISHSGTKRYCTLWRWYKGGMKSPIRLLFLPLVFVCGAATLSAQAPAKTPGFRDLFLDQLKDVESKVVGLAEAMPQEKYAWRPADGVRSVAEVFTHIAGANYMLPNFIGIKPPAGMTPALAKETDKAKVVEALKASFEHVRQGVTNLSDADLAKPVKLFGRETTYEGVLFLMANHMHEHLGQSIAYARTNGVTPPWSKKSGE